MKKNWLLLIILLQFFACSPILKKITGIRNLRLEEVSEIKEFCLTNKIPLNEAYFFSTYEKFDFPDSSQINYRFAGQLLVFDKNGNRIIYKGKQTGTYCSVPSEDFFSSLKPMFLPIDTANNLRSLLKGYINVESYQPPNIDSADYYMVYYWAFWYKKFSKKDLEEMKSILKNSDSLKIIQSFYLNNDYVKGNYPDTIDFTKEKINVSL